MGDALRLRPDLPVEAQLGLKAIEAEFIRATRRSGTFASQHEGWAVIREELDELWDEVKRNGDVTALRKEAIQVGAMALRFLTDCAPRLEPEEEEESDG